MAEIDVEVTWGGCEALNVSQASVGNILISGPVRLLGWSLLETSGAAAASATFESGATIVGQAQMASGTAANHSLPTGGVYCPQGLVIGAVAGAFSGCVFVSYMIP